VVEAFLEGYAQGVTPNPCLVCNRHIRWEFLLQRALAAGAEHMATGHYARLQTDDQGRVQIRRGVDAHKDQSYVLHVLGQEQLRHAMFPLGGYTKPEIRQMARDFGLSVAERPDSQDLCFLGGEDYREFLMRNQRQPQPHGPILHARGEPLGKHQGLAFYTIGQRKGLGITSREPLYVLGKDSARNALIVGEAEYLGRDTLRTVRVNWVSGEAPPTPLRVQVKIRYKAEPAWGLVTALEGGRAQVQFERRLRDITPGQAAVFYDEEICLGGGIIV
jgi:tRNA-specific 2-thiouridylase